MLALPKAFNYLASTSVLCGIDMFDKPYIAYIHQDGQPPHPYVQHAYSFFNMMFREKTVNKLHEQCNIMIEAAKSQILREQILEVLQEELAKIK